MKIQKINADTGQFEEYAREQDWLRVVINGRWYNLQHAPNGGLEVSSEHSLTISPRYSNSVWLLDNAP